MSEYINLRNRQREIIEEKNLLDEGLGELKSEKRLGRISEEQWESRRAPLVHQVRDLERELRGIKSQLDDHRFEEFAPEMADLLVEKLVGLLRSYGWTVTPPEDDTEGEEG
jgi:hypothetical protein